MHYQLTTRQLGFISHLLLDLSPTQDVCAGSTVVDAKILEHYVSDFPRILVADGYNRTVAQLTKPRRIINKSNAISDQHKI